MPASTTFRGVVQASVAGAFERRVRQLTVSGGLPGGCWLDEAPEDKVEYPLATFSYGRTDYVSSFEGIQSEHAYLTLQVFGFLAETVEKLARSLINGLLDGPLALDDGSLVQLYPMDLTVALNKKYRGPEGQRGFKAEVPFQVWVGGGSQ